ncbi:hypothetical protein U1Q18_002830 [Sarracenia purpurea var. burkii]
MLDACSDLISSSYQHEFWLSLGWLTLQNLKSCCKLDFIRQIRISGSSEPDAVRKYGHAVDIVIAVNGVSSLDHRNPKPRLKRGLLKSVDHILFIPFRAAKPSSVLFGIPEGPALRSRCSVMAVMGLALLGNGILFVSPR